MHVTRNPNGTGWVPQIAPFWVPRRYCHTIDADSCENVGVGRGATSWYQS